jgi:hypothetical protein
LRWYNRLCHIRQSLFIYGVYGADDGLREVKKVQFTLQMPLWVEATIPLTMPRYISPENIHPAY